jgi:transposase-like protein
MMPTQSTPSDIMPSPAQHALLARIAERLDAARHGEKVGIVADAAAELGVTMQTVHVWLRSHRHNPRKKRSDAGKTAISEAEKLSLASVVTETFRDNGKAGVAMTDAVAVLSEDNKLRCARVDNETGEVIPLSNSTISRALKAARMSPAQLRQPTPHQTLRSLHPNHVWQVDASVCVLYYLPKGADGESAPGLALMPIKKEKHYKNRLDNLKAIERFRVIRYVMTDHCSGLIRVWNYPHAESGAHTVDFLARLMAPKTDAHDPFQGRPKIVMVDPGATASGMVRRFCDVLGIRLIVNEAHNPRAKGQVEQANNLWERRFEAWLSCIRDQVRNFDDLNALSRRFQNWMNAHIPHTRHGEPRLDKWLAITPEQLVTTARAETLLELATGKSEHPTVRGNLTVRFAGKVWPVKHVPDIVIGEKLEVAASPFVEGGAVVLRRDADGKLLRYPLTAEAFDEHGFPLSAAVIGEEYKAVPDTAIERNAREVERFVTGQKTREDAQAARRQKGFQPFGGEVNPFIRVEAHEAAQANVLRLPMRGTPLATPEVATVLQKISPVAAAMRLKEAMGSGWNPETYEWLAKKYPDGIDPEALARMIDNVKTGGADVIAM